MREEIMLLGTEDVHKKLDKLVGNRDVLFIERDNILTDSVGKFYEWCVQAKKYVTPLCRLNDLSFDYICESVRWADVIVFMTQGDAEITEPLMKFLASLNRNGEQKIIIECYINEPTFLYLPKELEHHTFYQLDSYDEYVANWELDKAKVRK